VNEFTGIIFAIIIILYAILAFLMPVFIWQIKNQSVEQTKLLERIANNEK